MKILNEATRLVPKIHLPPATDRVGHDELQYLFLDFVDGEPLHPAILNGEESPQRLAQVIPDYALFRIKIKSVPFDRIGSIYPDPLDSSSTTVGPLIDLWFRFDDPPHFLGPFLSNKERYLAQIDFNLEMVEKGKLYPDDPNLIYLFHLDLRALIHLYQKWEEDTDERKFYLKHADDKGAHIFVNDEGHITGIIDWEWAYVTSKAEAFSPPLAMILPSSFWDGDNTLSSLEEMLITEYVNLGHSDLAKCVQEGKFYQRLNILLGYHPELNHLKALREIVTGDKICFANDGEYKDWCLTRYGEDEGYLRLLKNTIA
ncbi:hypothetical protein V865_003514 [Kwoniella europaea PYCC6329]|uniref:Aminoglycoside phosphotransferase domain-containing protein n=1 Tax=Kwoniella europaea PYCC6329 TaxID=1423913 RepID=A0AAX4KI72_9TREE